MKGKEFLKGIYSGIPIFLGYLSVSFGFGIMAVQSGLSTAEATAISALNLTSAGQAAGVGIIASGGSVVEMILSQLTINMRYSLMSLSLSQKLDKSFSFPHRLAAAYGITDEIFAVASARDKVTPWYMYGMILIAAVGWCAGTFLGAAAGNILPQNATDALGIMLYGMFIAIVIPPARKERGVLFAVLIAAGVSVFLYFVCPFISSGFAVIISAVAAAAVMAFVLPVKDDEKKSEEQ